MSLPEPFPAFDYTVTERFLRYVTIDTQSDPDLPTTPSTAKQKDLGRVLVADLREIGLSDADMDADGYVYATLPANTDKAVPVICFCSHMDTSPDAPGTGVKPQVWRNYQGGDIALPGDPGQVIRFADHAALQGPDRQRHRHLGRHHPARRRRQGGAGRDRRRHALPGGAPARSSTARSRCCSPRTRRSAAASTRSTSPGSAPTSPTPWTARPPATSRTRPSRPTPPP